MVPKELMCRINIIMNKLKHFIRSLKHEIFQIFRQLISYLILQNKWRADKKQLPLTSDHYEIYVNIHKASLKRLGYFPELVHCRDFNDKIQWLKLFDQDRIMIGCSDKIRVRDFVQATVGEHRLCKTYQICNHFNEIDFDALPDSFVIKTNHDSGSVILVDDKDTLDIKYASEKIEKALNRIYGWDFGEWAYAFIQPQIIIEEMIPSESNGGVADYKFYCVNGKMKFCHYIYNRKIKTKIQTLDRKGNNLELAIQPGYYLGNDFVLPTNWEEMIEIAEKLSATFKFVRIDMFNENNRIICGEMTFWPVAGLMEGDGKKDLGAFLEFDRNTFKPCLIKQLESEVGLRNKRSHKQ